MGKNTVLFLTSSIGAGHKQASNAVLDAIKQIDKDAQAQDIDYLEHIGKLKGKIQKKIYENFLMERIPGIYDFFYKLLDNKICAKIYNFTLGFQNKLNKELEEIKPKYIIVTHPFWLKELKNYKGDAKIGVIITDSIDIHHFRHVNHEKIDNYFVIDPFSKEIMQQKFKVPGENISVSFFPIEQKHFIDKENIGNKNIFFLLSGINKEFSINLLEEFKDTDFQITIIKGRSLYYKELKQKFSKYKNFKFIEFINIKENLKDVDVFIGKPGGAITNECIATNTPIVVPQYIPGQEEGNLKLIELLKIGFHSQQPEEIKKYLVQSDFNTLKTTFERIKNKTVCEDILKILGLQGPIISN